MKILSIDTASNICGVSILEDNNLICQLDTNTGRTHSENLMPMIEQIFNKTNLTLKDIDLFVCDKGPGSFTGIRIGVATIKAFQDSLSIAATGVSSLESLAYSIQNEGLIASIIDCKNDNCYFALYKLENAHYEEIIPPTANTIQNALNIIKDFYLEHPITFVGDGSKNYKDLIIQKFKNAFLADAKKNVLNSYYLGLAGFNKWKENKLEDVLPLYLKKPQAQRQLEETSKNVEITYMTLEDFSQISEYLTTDFDDFWNKDLLKEELTAKNSKYLVAKYNQEIVGFAGIKVLVEEADIMNIVIKKNFRNQGIGTLLLKKLLDLAKSLKLYTITLEVAEENNSAIHLYQKLGFEKVGIRKNYYQTQNGLIMQKKLT